MFPEFNTWPDLTYVTAHISLSKLPIATKDEGPEREMYEYINPYSRSLLISLYNVASLLILSNLIAGLSIFKMAQKYGKADSDFSF